MDTPIPPTPFVPAFKLGETVDHPQFGKRQIIALITDSAEPSAVIQGVAGSVPLRILKPQVSVKKPL